MQRKLIKDLEHHFDETVRIYGWVHTVRNQKKMQFLVLRDHTGLVQAINFKDQNETNAQLIDDIAPESAVEVIGKVVKNPNVKLKGIDFVIEEFKVVNAAEPQLPIDDNTALDGRLSWRFLDLRKEKNALVFKVQTLAEHAMREFWNQEGFTEIHSPKLMGTASESGAELFRLEYFDRFAYLAQSPQFYKQMGMAAGFDKVFEIGPVFRANPSFTSRHDTEFTSVDSEISWIDSHEDIMAFEERWLQYVLQKVKDELGDEIERVCGTEVIVPSLPFPRMTMAEAKDLLRGMGHDLPEDEDLNPECERLLSDYIKKEHGHEFVFVTDYPSSVRPFYHMRYDDNDRLTKSFDLLWKGLELTTGAQREHRYDVLLKQAEEKGLNPEPIQDYLNCFKFGCPPHGGFGFGLSRMLMLMLGFPNVREVTFLYRGPNRLTP